MSQKGVERRDLPYEDLVTHKVTFERLNELMLLPKQGYIFDGKESVKITVSK